VEVFQASRFKFQVFEVSQQINTKQNKTNLLHWKPFGRSALRIHTGGFPLMGWLGTAKLDF